MKDFGSVALGSSSARKYLRTCESCFQKLRVSCGGVACQIVMCFGRMWSTSNGCVPGIRHGFCR